MHGILMTGLINFACFIESSFVRKGKVLTCISCSMQHFIKPLGVCLAAEMCNHTWIYECGKDILELDIKLFLDECDMLEYSCDNAKVYQITDINECEFLTISKNNNTTDARSANLEFANYTETLISERYTSNILRLLKTTFNDFISSTINENYINKNTSNSFNSSITYATSPISEKYTLPNSNLSTFTSKTFSLSTNRNNRLLEKNSKSVNSSKVYITPSISKTDRIQNLSTIMSKALSSFTNSNDHVLKNVSNFVDSSANYVISSIAEINTSINPTPSKIILMLLNTSTTNKNPASVNTSGDISTTAKSILTGVNTQETASLLTDNGIIATLPKTDVTEFTVTTEMSTNMGITTPANTTSTVVIHNSTDPDKFVITRQSNSAKCTRLTTKFIPMNISTTNESSVYTTLISPPNLSSTTTIITSPLTTSITSSTTSSTSTEASIPISDVSTNIPPVTPFTNASKNTIPVNGLSTTPILSTPENNTTRNGSSTLQTSSTIDDITTNVCTCHIPTFSTFTVTSSTKATFSTNKTSNICTCHSQPQFQNSTENATTSENTTPFVLTSTIKVLSTPEDDISRNRSSTLKTSTSINDISNNICTCHARSSLTTGSTTSPMTTSAKTSTSVSGITAKDICTCHSTISETTTSSTVLSTTEVSSTSSTLTPTGSTTDELVNETTSTIMTTQFSSTSTTQSSVITCDKYSKECDRPVTWETTAVGETRDFFQILKSRFGNRIKLLRDTTHWPRRIFDSYAKDSFMFGKHHES